MADWIKRIDWGPDQRVKCCVCGSPVAVEVVSTRPCGDHWQARPYKVGESGKTELTGVWAWCPKCWEVERRVADGQLLLLGRSERIREWLRGLRVQVGAWIGHVGEEARLFARRLSGWLWLRGPSVSDILFLLSMAVCCWVTVASLIGHAHKPRAEALIKVVRVCVSPSVTMAVSCLGTYRVTWYASGKNLDGSSFRGLYDTCAARVIATRGEWLLVVRRTPEGHRFSTMVYVNDHMGAVVLHGKAQPPASVKALVQRKAVAALDLSGAAAKRLYMLSAGSYPCEVWELYPDTAEIKGGK